MLDHVTVGVRDMERSVAFYDRILAVTGIERRGGDGVGFAGYCAGRGCFFWIGLKTADITGMHVAFGVADRVSVDRFHAAGLAAGGRDNGPPGLRPQYHPDYYGTFALTRTAIISRLSVVARTKSAYPVTPRKNA